VSAKFDGRSKVLGSRGKVLAGFDSRSKISASFDSSSK
jgi:hypothetical protein